MPFHGRDIVTTMMSVATDEPTSPKKLNPKLPAELAGLIEKLLAKKPEERFASAQQVVDTIAKIEAQAPAEAHRPLAGGWRRASPWRSGDFRRLLLSAPPAAAGRSRVRV